MFIKVKLKNLFIYICSAEFVFLLFFNFKLWLFVYHYDKTNDFSKSKYYVKTDNEFVQKFNSIFSNSSDTLKQINEWLKLNANVFLDPTNPILFNNIEIIKNRTIQDDVLCAGILSKDRLINNRNYPLQTVLSILTRIPLKYQDRVSINLFNVDGTLSNRDDLKELNNLIKIIDLKQNISDLLNSYENPKIKEAADYATLMNYYYVHRNECGLVLLIEDDSIACLNWYDKVIQAVKTINSTSSNWYCLKLFTSFRSFDWVIHPLTVLKTILFVIVVSFVLIYFLNCLLLIKKYICLNYFKYQLKIKNRFSELSVYLLILNVLLIKLWLNSKSISPLGYGVKKYSIGFNTVANVYPRSKLNLISNHIETNILNYVNSISKKFDPKDISLNRFKKINGLDEYIIEPSIFQHIGLHSSLGGIVDLNNIKFVQYRPFQSYSFIKEYPMTIQFDPNFWLT